MRTHLKTSSQGRIAGLDLLRAMAIVWVMLFHTRGLNLPFSGVARYGWMGVDLFFCLSGYLIASQLLKAHLEDRRADLRGHLACFYWRRAWRILPTYLVVLTLYFALPVWREAPGMTPLWSFLTFTENFVIDYANVQAFSHAWSLCVEEHFYLVLPLILAFLMRERSRWSGFVLGGGLLIGGVLLRWLLWRHLAQQYSEDEGGFSLGYIERIYYPTYARLDGLLAGVSVAAIRWCRPVWWSTLTRRSNLLAAGGLGAVAVAIWITADRLSEIATVLGLPVLAIGFGALVMAAASDRGAITRPRFTGVKWTATLAYSLYLIHKEIVHLDGLYLARFVKGGGYRALAIYGVTTFAAAAILYFAVERPGILIGQRLLSARRVNPEREVLLDPAI